MGTLGVTPTDTPRHGQALIKAGAQINIRDKNGATPLHWCSWNNDEAGMQVLLEAGADVDVKDYDGKTPLHDAAWKGNVETVQTERGPEPSDLQLKFKQRPEECVIA